MKPLIIYLTKDKKAGNLIHKTLEPVYRLNGFDSIEKCLTEIKNKIPDIFIFVSNKYSTTQWNKVFNEIKSGRTTSQILIILLYDQNGKITTQGNAQNKPDDSIPLPLNSELLKARINNLLNLRQNFQNQIQGELDLRPVTLQKASLDDSFMEKLKGVIEENLAFPEFNEESLAGKMGMKLKSMKRKIKALTGETASAFIRSYRLNRAAQLLEGNAGNIEKAAKETGFVSMEEFRKGFKDIFHRMPEDLLP